MTTTDLIILLHNFEKGSSERSREIRIYKKGKNNAKILVFDESDCFGVLSTGDGISGAELSLLIK